MMGEPVSRQDRLFYEFDLEDMVPGSLAGDLYIPGSHARPAFIRAAALYPDPTGAYALRTRSSSIANLARFAPR